MAKKESKGKKHVRSAKERAERRASFVVVHVPPPLKKKIFSQAKKEERSMSDYIRHLLEQRLGGKAKPKAAKKRAAPKQKVNGAAVEPPSPSVN